MTDPEQYGEEARFHPGSPVLEMLYKLDDKFLRQKIAIEKLEEERDYWQGMTIELQNKQMADAHTLTGNILLAAIGASSKDSLDPLSATIMVTLRDMATIEQVHAYIDKAFEREKQ